MSNPETEMKRCALYVRVSTDKQEELSPDAQKRLLLEYAKSHGMIAAKQHIYLENGISGRKADKRPAFQAMIAAAKAKEFDVILVWKFSRFARNQEESIVYKSMLRKKLDIDVVSISEPIIDGPFGSLIERIIEWMDEYYSVRLSGEVMRGMTEKALRGGYQAQPPIGYRMNNKVPEIVPEEAKFVHLVFDRYEAGYDISSIALYCNDIGYRTSRGSLWENRTIKYILQNPFYIGQVRWNRAKHSSHIQNDPDDIIIRPGIHEPIISTEQWERVQLRLSHELLPYRARPAQSTSHWLSGMIKCNICGKSLGYHKEYVNKQGKTCAPYFQCIEYIKGKHSGSQCLMEREAVSCILSALEDTLTTSKVDFRLRHLNQSAETTRRDKLLQELEKCKAREERCKMAYMDGIDTIEEYKANKLKLKSFRKELEEQLDALSSSGETDTAATSKQMLIKIQSVVDILKDEKSDMEIKKNTLRSIVEKIVYIKEEKRLDIYYYLSV